MLRIGREGGCGGKKGSVDTRTEAAVNKQIKKWDKR